MMSDLKASVKTTKHRPLISHRPSCREVSLEPTFRALQNTIITCSFSGVPFTSNSSKE